MQKLRHRLTGGLGGDTAELGGIDLLLDDIAHLSAGLEGLGFLDVNLEFGVADRIHHAQNRPSLQLAVLGVDLDLQILAGINPLQGGGFDGVDDRRDHVGARDAPFLLHVFEDGEDFLAHVESSIEGKKKAGQRAHFSGK